MSPNPNPCLNELITSISACLPASPCSDSESLGLVGSALRDPFILAAVDHLGAQNVPPSYSSSPLRGASTCVCGLCAG